MGLSATQKFVIKSLCLNQIFSQFSKLAERPIPGCSEMAKGASKDKKPAENKGSGKGKGKSEEAADKSGKVRAVYLGFLIFSFLVLTLRDQGMGGLKPATAINVRHILCEKRSKATEALQRIQVRCRCPLFIVGSVNPLCVVSGRGAIRQSCARMFRGQSQRFMSLQTFQLSHT